MVKRLLLLCAFAFAANAETVVIRDVRVFDGEKVIPRATVTVKDGVIAEVKASAGKNSPNATQTLIPGLIDSHTHTWGDALVRSLRFGVTTGLDMFTNNDFAREMRKPATDRAELRSAGTLITVKGGHGSQYFKIPVFEPGSDAQAFVDARVAEESDYIKIVYEGGEAYGQKWPTITRDDLAKLIAAAKKRGKMAVVHVSTLDRAIEALEAGADGLVHIFGSKPSPDFGKLAANKRAFVIPTLTVVESATGTPSGASLIDDARLGPYTNSAEKQGLKQAFPQRRDASSELDNAMAAVRQLRDARVPILAGSDAPNPGTAHGVSMHRELELLVKAGLTPVEALAAATSVPAKAFGLTDRGRIAVGKKADLVLVNGDPTRDILATRNIAAIWKSGVPVAREPEAKVVEAPVQRPSPEELAAVISDFESGAATSTFGSGWMISTDSIFGGKSVAEMEVVGAGGDRAGRALKVKSDSKEGAPFPWAGAMLWFGATPMEPVDFSGTTGISFHARGDAIRVMLLSHSGGQVPRLKSLPASPAWTERVVTWASLGIDPKDVQGVLLAGPASGTAEFFVDDVRLK